MDALLNETDLSFDEIRAIEQQSIEYIEQGSEGWHTERLGNATASEIWKVVIWTKGNSKTAPKPTAYWYSYRNELVAERLSGKYKRFKSRQMEWGNDHENDAALEYERITGNEIRELGFIKHSELNAGASLDRETGKDGLVEIKCPNTDTVVSYVLSGIPPNYFAQMQMQMWVANKKWGDFVVFDPALGNTYIQHVERDDEYIQNTMIPRLNKFLGEVDEVEKRMRELGYAQENG